MSNQFDEFITLKPPTSDDINLDMKYAYSAVNNIKFTKFKLDVTKYESWQILNIQKNINRHTTYILTEGKKYLIGYY